MQERPRVSVFCHACGKDSLCRRTNGSEIYPHIQRLHKDKFLRCDVCGNHVSASKRWEPKAALVSKDVRKARIHIHALLDPLWQKGLFGRRDLYIFLSKTLGYEYHTAQITDLQTARDVYSLIKKVSIKEIDIYA